MSRRLLPAVLASGLVVGAVVATFVLWQRADVQGAADEEPLVAIEADATIAPRVVLFGDTVFANVDVVLDPERVDPGSVRVAVDFAPFEVVGRPERRRLSSRSGVALRTTYALRCLTGACVPSQRSATYELEPVRISFAGRGAETVDDVPLAAPLPAVHVYSRFAAISSRSEGDSTPWRADLLSLPAASYRLAPRSLVALLLAAAALLAAGSVTVAAVAWPRRRPLPPPPEPEPEPVHVPSPLEQALAFLERSLREDGGGDQRRALELVAEELELAEWGDRELARAARALAWSEDVPPVGETTRLAARVRDALPREQGSPENGNGSVG